MALNIIYPLLSLGMVLSIWAIIAKAINKSLLMPMPSEVFDSFFNLFTLSNFWGSVGWTILRTLICFLISFLAAFLLATIGGLIKPIHRIISPIVSILRSAPTMAVILILMIWVDYDKVPVYIGFLIAFPILYSAFYTAITSVDKDLVEMSKVYKVSPYNRVKSLYIPSIANSVFDASQSTISLTLKVVIASEVLCYTKKSIGLNMMFANSNFDLPYLLAWTVLAIILSFVFELMVLSLKKVWEVSR